jgi:2-polyprenyl-6-methoxyphenol hydroxylase-like FAD-dependent oxidoreductase
MTTPRDVHVVIVGGSLVGLSSALALDGAGVQVTVLERSGAASYEGGGGLGVDVELVQGVTGIASSPPVCHGPDRDTTAWHLLRDWLEHAVDARPSINLYHGATVTSVIERGDRVEVVSQEGQMWSGDAVIGATVCIALCGDSWILITRWRHMPGSFFGASWCRRRRWPN